MTDTEIRPFRDDDRAAIVAFQNERRPAHLRETVAEWEQADALRPAGEVRLRLCVGTPPTAFVSAADRGTSAHRKAGVCSFNLSVADEARWADWGAALYERVAAFAQGRGLGRLETHIRPLRPGEPLTAFLESRGFAVVDREVPALLDLAAFDRTRFEGARAVDGIKLASWAEAGDTADNRRRLYALVAALDRDVPTHGVHSDPPPFEEFEKDFSRPAWDSDALVLAETDAGEWVGLSQVGFQEHTGIGWTFLTGVLPAHRGRGLALALKLRVIDAALARGCPLILTENHEDNAPMRAVNRKLGFVPDFPGVSYAKDLQEGEH